MSVFIEHDIFGHTFLILPQEDGHKFWVCIVTIIDDHGTKVAHDPGNIQFINSSNHYQYDKVMLCNNIPDNIVQKGDKYIVWEFKDITTHKEPIILSKPNYNGYWCNVIVEWDIGETITSHLINIRWCYNS